MAAWMRLVAVRQGTQLPRDQFERNTAQMVGYHITSECATSEGLGEPAGRE